MDLADKKLSFTISRTNQSSTSRGLAHSSGSVSFRPLLAGQSSHDNVLLELRQFSAKKSGHIATSPVDITQPGADEQVLLDRTQVKRTFDHQNVVLLSTDLEKYLDILEKVAAGPKKRPRSKVVIEAEDRVVISVRDASEQMVWADQKAPVLWASFAELDVAQKMATIAELSSSRNVRFQILQTFSIIVHSIRPDTLRSYIYPREVPNRILCADYDFSDDEILLYYIALIRSLSCMIHPRDLTYLVVGRNTNNPSFPLYSQILRFFDHPDSIVRIAVRNVTLSLFLNGGPDALQYAVLGSDAPDHYFRRLARRITTISEVVVRVFLESNTKEPSTHKLLALGDVLEELYNMLEYFNEAISISPTVIGPFLGGIIMEAIRPLIFKLTSQVKAARGKGRTGPAQFAGLLITIALIIHKMEQKVMGLALSAEIATFIDSVGYSPMYGVKAVACSARDERCVNLALCAMEGTVSSRFVSVDNLENAQYLISEDGVNRSLGMKESQSRVVGQPSEDEECVLGVYREEMIVSETQVNRNAIRPKEVWRSLRDSNTAENRHRKGPSDLGSHLVQLELGNDFRVAEDVEDALLLIFLRPSLGRSVRVLQSGARLILAIAKKADSAVPCLLFVRRMLDELLENMAQYLNAMGGELDAAAVDSLFHMFAQATRDGSGLAESPSVLEKELLDPWQSVVQARYDDVPRKRAWGTMATPEPVCRQGDVDAFLVLFWLYSTLCSSLSMGPSDDSNAVVRESVETLFQAVRGLFTRTDCGIDRKTKIVLGVLAMVIEHKTETVVSRQESPKMARTKSLFTEALAYRQLTAKIRENLETAMQSRSDMEEDEDNDVFEILNSLQDRQSTPREVQREVVEGSNDDFVKADGNPSAATTDSEVGTVPRKDLSTCHACPFSPETGELPLTEFITCSEESISIDSIE